jgi:DNA helicase-2/ATP-dependent DNA helicase PcrA
VESRFGQQQMIDPDELPGRGDAGIDDDDDLRELVKRFEEGPFGDRTPYAVEPAFALVLAGQVVRGRIDAVYEEQVDGRDGFLVVDWKTNRRQTADALQLAIYRVAWAELAGRGAGAGARGVPLRAQRRDRHARRGRPSRPRRAGERSSCG